MKGALDTGLLPAGAIGGPDARLPVLDELARSEIVEKDVAPGASLAVSRLCPRPPGPADPGRDATWEALGVGGMLSVERPVPVHPGTPFDLASVTKPLVACAIVRLARLGVLALPDAIARFVPELDGTPSGSLSFELLLSHRAGLEAHVALYAARPEGERLDPWAMIRLAAHARRPDCTGAPPSDGFPPLYSDLGYILAGAAASRAAGLTPSALVDREVLVPLGLELELGSARALRERGHAFDAEVAPTECVPGRGGEVRGQVHDENAWALTGDSLSGHAGLFGTARGVVRFGVAILEALEGRRRGWLTPAEAAALVRERPGGTLRAGFDGKATQGSSAGNEFGPLSFGHLGFTGTSLWCDPDARIAAVLLTNRVNPSRENLGIRQARPVVHDVLHRTARDPGAVPEANQQKSSPIR